jgi:hypothetical protein
MMTTLWQRDATCRTTEHEPGIDPVADTASCYWRDLDRSDDSLLDFGLDLAHGHEGAQDLLRLHPTIYRNHLAIAKFLDGWIDRVWRDAEVGAFEIAYVQALLEITDRLRAGDFTDAPADRAAMSAEVDLERVDLG